MGAPEGEALGYAYDGPLATTTAWTGTVEGAVARTYDGDLRVTSLAVESSGPMGGEVRSWAYGYADPDGLLTQAGDLTLTRDPDNGLLTATTLGSVTTTTTYTTLGELYPTTTPPSSSSTRVVLPRASRARCVSR